MSMSEYYRAHQLEIWKIVAGVCAFLFLLSERLGLSKKYESNAVYQLVMKMVKKGAGIEDAPKSDDAPPAA
jgi:hypothetical protein